MRNYELMLFLPSALSEEEAQQSVQAIASRIQELGGIVAKSDIRGRRKFFGNTGTGNEAYLAHIGFSMNADQIDAIKQATKENSQIIRALVLTKPVKAARAVPTISRSPQLKTPAKEPEERRVEMEDIDKKLEEILNE